jgi:repressor LexA
MEGIGKRIKKLRETLGLTQEEFGARVQLSSGAICDIEKGIRGSKKGIGADTIARICKAFNIDPKWLLFGEEGTESVKSIKVKSPESYFINLIPIINEVPASYPAYPVLDDYIQGYVYIPESPKNAFGLLVKGDSMSPELNDGDIVIVSPGNEIKKRQIGIFRVNGETTIKFYLPLDKETLILQPANPKYPPIVIREGMECTIIGRVIYRIVKYE